MNCPECEREMSFPACYDEGCDGKYAYNLYQCEYCGVLVKQDVWDNKGCLIITAENKISFNYKSFIKG